MFAATFNTNSKVNRDVFLKAKVTCNVYYNLLQATHEW